LLLSLNTFAGGAIGLRVVIFAEGRRLFIGTLATTNMAKRSFVGLVFRGGQIL
jgi:hypothetical protein